VDPDEESVFRNAWSAGPHGTICLLLGSRDDLLHLCLVDASECANRVERGQHPRLLVLRDGDVIDGNRLLVTDGQLDMPMSI
jgi:hypothetical protein